MFASNDNLHIVTVSDWLASLVKQSFLGGKDIRVIKNGVDLDVFKPNESKRKKSLVAGKKLVIGVAGVWTKAKGLDDIYKLREKLSQDEFEIILVGLKESQKKELPNGITGIGRTESIEELVNLYSSANVLVNPTYADTFPTVNLEALACGTPIVTYQTGGSPEAVDEKTGIVVEQGNVESLSEAIVSLCEKSKAQMINDCRQKAVDEFDKNERYKDYFSVYKDVVGGIFDTWSRCSLD